MSAAGSDSHASPTPMILRNGQIWATDESDAGGSNEPRAAVSNDRRPCAMGLDRALQFGDGLFETVRLDQGMPRFWPRHWQRLGNGCARLGLPLPDERACLDDLAAVAAQGHASAKLIWSAGPGPRGYYRPRPLRPARWCVGGGSAAASRAALVVGISTVPVSIQPHLAGIKHLNRLDQVLARAAMPAHWDEALQFDADGWLVCATAANVFLRCAGVWITPPVDRAGVAGTRRAALLDAALIAGAKIRIESVTPTMLAGCEALVLTSTMLGVRSVASLEWTATDAASARRLCLQRALPAGSEQLA